MTGHVVVADLTLSCALDLDPPLDLTQDRPPDPGHAQDLALDINIGHIRAPDPDPTPTPNHSTKCTLLVLKVVHGQPRIKRRKK